MINLEWHESLVINVESISQDHRKRLNLTRQTRERVAYRQPAYCQLTHNQLISIVQEQSVREEDLVRDIGFPVPKQPMKYHDRRFQVLTKQVQGPSLVNATEA